MGEIRTARLARGKRVVVVKPVNSRRDPNTVAALTIGETTALLTDNERRELIEALGGHA